jgi:hypothetical protein
MALVSLVRAHCSDLSFKNYLLRKHYKSLVFLEIACCSDPSCTKLLAQGALHGAGVTGESALF